MYRGSVGHFESLLLGFHGCSLQAFVVRVLRAATRTLTALNTLTDYDTFNRSSAGRRFRQSAGSAQVMGMASYTPVGGGAVEEGGGLRAQRMHAEQAVIQ